jgi:membrane AbrB-like protein
MLPHFLPLSKFAHPVRWGVLVILSALFSALLSEVHLPAALLLGAIIAGILVESGQADIHIPDLPYNIAQGIIGCLVAKVLSLEIVYAFMERWPVFLVIVTIIIVSCCFLGWTISKLGILPGTTAIWGLLPGAASAMMLMSESFGADARLVALMQYLRVVLVVAIASIIAHLWGHVSVAPAPIIWFSVIHWLPFLETLAIILSGSAIGYIWKPPAGMLLIPLFVGSALHLGGLVDIELPKWLLAMGYLCIGWQIGLRFTRKVLVHAARVLPQIIISILAVIVFCGGLAYLLTKFLDIDPLTAYLATSPGGVDAVAIIAASANVNVGFVMTLQLSRALLVVFVGPVISRFFSNRLSRKALDKRQFPAPMDDC